MVLYKKTATILIIENSPGLAPLEAPQPSIKDQYPRNSCEAIFQNVIYLPRGALSAIVLPLIFTAIFITPQRGII
jgi:hypothetical protein